MKWPAAVLIGATVVSFVLPCAARAGPLDVAREAELHHDYATALGIIRPLAERGDAVAQYELGDMYYVGTGVPQAAAEAAKWYQRAALQGLPAAQHMLALSYEYGTGVVTNPAEGLKWLRRAADQGYGASQHRLAEMYESPSRFSGNGPYQGIGQDYVEAHKWFNLSAASGEPGGERDRTELEKKMTPAQIDEAQRRAAAWRPRPEQ
jgi:TPR repeat protein